MRRRASADAGCRVTIRYIAQAGRAGVPEQVFAQMLAGFEIATQDPRFVGLNLVQPEDDPTAVRDFSLHMRMLDFLHAKVSARVRSRCTPASSSKGSCRRKRCASTSASPMRTGHARRIGHGGGIMYEDDPLGLLREMAAKRVLVEIALSSNDLILGVRGKRHPLAHVSEVRRAGRARHRRRRAWRGRR